MPLSTAHTVALAASPLRTDADAAAFLTAIDSPLAGSFDLVGSRGAYRLVSAACERCGGSGQYSAYHGECFACGGADTRDAKRRVYLLTEARGAKARLRREAREMQERDASEAAALAADPELAEALKGSHHILQDLAASLRRWGRLTDKQRALALKIHAQQQQQQAEAATLTDAPEGRHALEGEVLSTRWDAGYTGDPVAKMLLAVDDALGRFKVWTTIPAALVDAVDSLDALKGQRVALTVTLTPRERGFAIGKRPAKGALVSAASTDASEQAATDASEQAATDAPEQAATDASEQAATDAPGWGPLTRKNATLDVWLDHVYSNTCYNHSEAELRRAYQRGECALDVVEESEAALDAELFEW